MGSSLQYESFYKSGVYSVPEMGIYAGWVAHEISLGAGQPFFNEQRDVVLLFSGECFADAEMRGDLRKKGHDVSQATAGWMVHLYEEEGDRFFEKLNGLFSGLLIDKRQAKAFLFNDRYGVERLYSHETDDSLYFASEAKALLRVLPMLRHFDPEGLGQFLSYGCTMGSRTLFKNIELLPAGSCWTFENGRRSTGKYFSPEQWEAQPMLAPETFEAKFYETVNRVLPRYFESNYKIGISLTGGLDSRMIVACRPGTQPDPVCYTFSGKTGKTFDDRLAREVAKTCGLKHKLLRLDSDFFSNFANYADRTIYVTDGYFGVTGAHEIYLNNKARQLSPVRLTGNFGSEILRGVSTFQRLGLTAELIDPEFSDTLDSVSRSCGNKGEHPVTFAAFREVPCNLFGSLAAGRSETVFRTPYLDNEIVALAYQMPDKFRTSPDPTVRLIAKANPMLATIPGDLGQIGRNGLLGVLTRLFGKVTFKIDYLNNEGFPHWLLPVEPLARNYGFILGLIGQHKYLHYRSWFRRELASYLRDSLMGSNRNPCFNSTFVGRMASEHIDGRKNYLKEINAVLTLEAVERLLFRDFADKYQDDTGHLGRLSSIGINGHGNDQVNVSAKSKAASRKGGTELKWWPTFLGIGSMRCGSTWLYEVLKLHSDIRMSGCKEMDFFFMAQMLQHDLRWYESQFRPDNGTKPKPIRGEISPLYARLKAWQVKRIAELLPDARIILTLRHPVERVWSQALYEFGFRSQRDLRKVRSSEFLRQLERPRSKLSSDYYHTVRVWSDAFGSEALHISLFDELRDDPQTYVNDILRHIGASTPWPLPSELTQKKVWATNSLVKQQRDIPEVVQWYIADQLLEPTERLNELLEGRVSNWVDELREIRGRTRISWRILKEFNRTILSLPEGLAYEAYHAILDVRLWRRWRKLQAAHLNGQKSFDE